MITLLPEYEVWKTVLYILNGSHYNIDFVSSRKLQKKEKKTKKKERNTHTTHNEEKR